MAPETKIGQQQGSEVLTYGVTEQRKLSDAMDKYAEECVCGGYTILPEVFNAKQVQDLARAIDEVYEIQKKDFGGGAQLSRIHDDDIARCPLAYHDSFLAVATHKKIHDLLGRLLGKSYILMQQNAIINREAKEQYQVRWHRDLNYQHWTTSRPFAFNFLVAVDNFFEAGGATWVLPGSHRFEQFPSDEYVKKYQLCLEAKPGSVIVMDAMAYHRSGINRTPGYLRRAVNHVVGAPFMAQQIDMPSLLARRGKDHSKDPFLSAYLGYRWNPSPDVEAWRRKHMK